MDALENASKPTSLLPQPARSSQRSPTKALSELSASTNNARVGAMPPPPLHGQKHYISGLPEPPAKRKTLAERAGEPSKQRPVAPSTNGVDPSTSSFAHARTVSSSSSTTSRTASSTSRNTSNTSFSASLGPGALRPSQSISNLARPKSSLARDRASKLADSRPATAQGNHGGILAQAKRMTRTPSLKLPDRAIKPMTRNPFFMPNGLPLVTPPRPPRAPGVPCRDLSLSSAMKELTLQPRAPPEPSNGRQSPSKLPRPMTPVPMPPSIPLTVIKSTRASPKNYLTKESLIEAWDPNEQYDNIERMYRDTCINFKESLNTQIELKETNQVYQTMIRNLEQERNSLSEQLIGLRSELESTRYCLTTAEETKEETKRDLEAENEDLRRQQRVEVENVRQAFKDEIAQIKAEHRDDMRESKKRLEDEIEAERTQRIQAISQVSTQGALEKQKQQLELESREQEIRSLRAEIEGVKTALEREKVLNDDLRQNLSTAGSNAASMEGARQALQAKIEYLESDNKSQSEAYAAMERRMNEALAKAIECEDRLRQEETKRRKLHNQVQELKGNIRVFCRVRPLLSNDGEEIAKMSYPDTEESRDIEVKGPEETSSLGKVTTKSYPFSFDKVFDPTSNNAEIFEEISQLIQSALDGFNVCIFAYGQTGSGKTYTMSNEDGMIPLALRQIYTTSKELERRGWQYSMEGSFVEVYNEELRDLLGDPNDTDKPKKHEIRHDPLKHETTITEVTTVNLNSQDQVEALLARAMSRRSVAATKANERSSRSHSVFILKLAGHNTITGETIKGTLNLVDLAGSERLSHSKVEGARLKETQNINKSLSCLGDVIGALGQQQAGSASGSFDGRSSINGSSVASGSSGGGAGHIPYRNSKLTYLLQFSLGGNSKTLMFVMVAPEKKCLSETLTSLKFAEKVSRTKIGVARKSR